MFEKEHSHEGRYLILTTFKVKLMETWKQLYIKVKYTNNHHLAEQVSMEHTRSKSVVLVLLFIVKTARLKKKR